MIWLLGALLVVAMLDKVPDPPAAKPSNTQVSAYCMLEHGTAAVPLLAPIGVQPETRIWQITAVENPQTFPFRDLLIRIEQAGDPSPPILS
jgi:hypothetical protein